MREARDGFEGFGGAGEPTVRYRVSPGEPLGQAVVRAAESAGVTPDATGTVLDDVVNADALDRLYSNPEAGFAVFAVWGLTFVVFADEVHVYGGGTGEAERERTVTP